MAEVLFLHNYNQCFIYVKNRSLSLNRHFEFAVYTIKKRL
jgi:hypothetical protein